MPGGLHFYKTLARDSGGLYTVHEHAVVGTQSGSLRAAQAPAPVALAVRMLAASVAVQCVKAAVAPPRAARAAHSTRRATSCRAALLVALGHMLVVARAVPALAACSAVVR